MRSCSRRARSRRGDVRVQRDTGAGSAGDRGDQHQLCQVLTNLLINAFEALGGQGTIEIGAAEDALDEDPTTRATPQRRRRPSS